MALPTTKQGLADWILRRLGAPMINVELADIQLEDAIDEAVQWYQNWHYDGSQRSYRTIKITAEMLAGNRRIHQNINAPAYNPTTGYFIGDRIMISNKIFVKVDSDAVTFDSEWTYEAAALNNTDGIDYTSQGQVGIPIPNDIISVVKIFRVDGQGVAGMWNQEYQYFLNDMNWFKGGGSMASYYISKTNMGMLDNMLNTQPAIRFNKHKNKLYIDTNWAKSAFVVGAYMVAEVYEVTDPEVFGDVYQDMWLKRYSTALAKKQWGSNLKKYQNTELPGGIMLSGQELYDEAMEEVTALELELKTTNLEMDSIIWG